MGQTTTSACNYFTKRQMPLQIKKGQAKYLKITKKKIAQKISVLIQISIGFKSTRFMSRGFTIEYKMFSFTISIQVRLQSQPAGGIKIQRHRL